MRHRFLGTYTHAPDRFAPASAAAVVTLSTKSHIPRGRDKRAGFAARLLRGADFVKLGCARVIKAA